MLSSAWMQHQRIGNSKTFDTTEVQDVPKESLHPVSNHQYVPTMSPPHLLNNRHTIKSMHIWGQTLSSSILCTHMESTSIHDQWKNMKRQALPMIIQCVLTRVLTHTYSCKTTCSWYGDTFFKWSQQSPSSGLSEYDLVFKCGFFVSNEP